MITEKREEKAVADTKASVSHEGHRQRMKNRLLTSGLESFSGHEVLEVLLYYAQPYKDTNGLGHALEDAFGSLVNVLEADYADLVKIPGITPHMATLVTLCGQMSRRYQQEQHQLKRQLYSTALICDYVLPWFSGRKDESVVLVSMDNKRKLLNTTRVFEGSVNAAEMNIRLAAKQALQDNATQVVLAHNHPNGFAIPSEADVETTARFAAVLAQLDIRLIDHIIVAEGDCVSLADSRETAHLFRRGPYPAAAVADQEAL